MTMINYVAGWKRRGVVQAGTNVLPAEAVTSSNFGRLVTMTHVGNAERRFVEMSSLIGARSEH